MPMQVAGPVRNTYNAEGRFFAVAGNTLFQITAAGISVPLGTIPGTGRVSFAHNQITNGNEILVNNGNAGYVYNTVTQVFQRITDTSYPGGLNAVFINNRFVQIEPARRYLFNSALADGLNYNALDRFTSETSPDLVMSIQAIGNQLAVFSSTTTEWFEDTGANPQPFRSTGIVADKGAAGPFATAKLDNQMFMLADDGVFYRYQGYQPVRISTKPIEQAIRGKKWFNVFTTVWEDSGYAVCYWTFPDGQTWGYDASTNKWHRRESYGYNRWRLNSITYWQNANYGGDFQNGRLWKLDWDYLLEGDQEFESIRAAGVISDNQNRVIHERLEAIMDTGMVETVPIDFVDQPEGPTLTGEAPDAVSGDPYSFSYTATPGDAPIARTILMPGSYVTINGVQKTIPTAGWSWNQATATLTGSSPVPNTAIHLELRTYDTNGLYDEHSDELTVISQVLLLVSGTSIGGGQPVAAQMQTVGPFEFTGIPQSSGLDLQGGTPMYYDGRWAVLGSTEYLYSLDDHASWGSDPLPFTDGDIARRFVAGPEGWIVSTIEESPAQMAKTDDIAVDPFAIYDFMLDRSIVLPIENIGMGRLIGGYYYIDPKSIPGYLSRSQDPGAVWQVMHARGDSAHPNADISRFYDVIEHDGALYATVTRGVSPTRYQLRRSMDMGVTWPELLIDVDGSGARPWQLSSGNGVLVVYCWGGLECYTSTDNFATTYLTGIASTRASGGPQNEPKGRQIVYAGGYHYMISGAYIDPAFANKCVRTIDGVEFSEPVSIPVNSAIGIAAGSPA